ncbi:hypothetical protein KIL84_000075 [Mauremys mutica]|uniref:Uncharacterized protein n=1 Tax=Mauremys mutica TaxID=74926 RepID=A0A9D3XDY3_9SAUR|nr:hypothetical protein KIL84_000075 [Mauremys mutica]
MHEAGGPATGAPPSPLGSCRAKNGSAQGDPADPSRQALHHLMVSDSKALGYRRCQHGYQTIASRRLQPTSDSAIAGWEPAFPALSHPERIRGSQRADTPHYILLSCETVLVPEMSP